MLRKKLRLSLLRRICQTIIILFLCVSSFACSNRVNAKGQIKMTSNTTCQQTQLRKSQEMIRFILDDLTVSYKHVGGGGISAIKLTATNTYLVSLPQEERIDEITYKLNIDKECKISIVSRKESTRTPWKH